jgi:hypothetical protein
MRKGDRPSNSYPVLNLKLFEEKPLNTVKGQDLPVA